MNDDQKRARRITADIALAHSAIGVDLSSAARDFDSLEGDALRSRLLATSAELRRLGDAEHDMARTLHSIALGDVGGELEEPRLTATDGEVEHSGEAITAPIVSVPLPAWKLWLKFIFKL